MEQVKDDSPGHVLGVKSARLEPMSFEKYRNSPKRNQKHKSQ
jgi:hypothetical protein